MSDYARYLSENGGMASCGKGLGVFVGTDPNSTPLGWAFVQIGSPHEIVQEALTQMKLGWAIVS